MNVCTAGKCAEVQKAKLLCSRHYQQLRRMTYEEILARAALESPDRRCEQCGKDLAGKRSNARFCDRSCKSASAHLRLRATPEGKAAQRIRNKARYLKERSKRVAGAKAYYHFNAEQRRQYAVQWRLDNPHRRRDQRDRRAELILSNPGFIPFGDAEWQKLLRRHDYCCAYCGVRSNALEKDHVVPLTRGGRHAISNILPACKSCNVSKYDHLLAEWRYARRTAHALAA